MRRRFREVERKLQGDVRLENTTSNQDGYKAIKPETNITFEEAEKFWDNFFEQMAKENQ